jgi:thiamine biosynthesis lipoprotein
MIKQIRLIMGMPITIEIPNFGSQIPNPDDVEEVFDYFRYVDENYSPYKEQSQVGKLNKGKEVSAEMKKILQISEETKRVTNGYFDIRRPDGKIDPSGIVKGWAIKNAADILRKLGYKKFYVDAGGDAEIVGRNWRWGIRNPFNVGEVVKVLRLSNCGIATSGNYERGNHIYNPKTGMNEDNGIVSITVIGPNVYEADRFATAAFAMGRPGIEFIESLRGFEGYMIDNKRMATATSGFKKYEDD